MKIAVIGAGIAGLSTAHRLASDGHEVSIFESARTACEGASFTTTGLMANCNLQAAGGPISSQGSLSMRMRLLRRFEIASGWHSRDLRWLWKWTGQIPDQELSGRMKCLSALVTQTQERMLDTATHARFEFESGNGHLIVFKTERDWQDAASHIQLMRDLGIKVKDLTVQEILQIDPAFYPEAKIHCGVLVAQDSAANCRQYAHFLKDEIKKMGAQLHFNTRVKSVRSGGELTIDADGNEKNIRFDNVVICTNRLDPEMAPDIALKLPNVQLGSYCISAPVHENVYAPRHSFTDFHSGCTITHLGHRVRVSGGAEIGKPTETHRNKTVQKLFKALQNYYPGAAKLPAGIQTSKAYQTVTPDGLPYVGNSGVNGIWLNLGHGANGWATSLACADVLTEQLQGSESDLSNVDWKLLSPKRFSVS